MGRGVGVSTEELGAFLLTIPYEPTPTFSNGQQRNLVVTESRSNLTEI